MKARLPDEFRRKGAGNMQNMMKQAQQMQADMETMQDELEKREYSATVGGGAVTATVGGDHMVKTLEIQQDVVDSDDVDMLSDLIIAAVNEAIRQAVETSEEEMGKISGGLAGLL